MIERESECARIDVVATAARCDLLEQRHQLLLFGDIARPANPLVGLARLGLSPERGPNRNAPRVTELRIQVDVDDRLELAHRVISRSVENREAAVFEFKVEVFERREQQGFLRAEIKTHDARGEVRDFGDLRDRRSGESVSGDRSDRGFDQLAAAARVSGFRGL